MEPTQLAVPNRLFLQGFELLAQSSTSADAEQGSVSCSSLVAQSHLPWALHCPGLRALFRAPERNGTWMAGMTHRASQPKVQHIPPDRMRSEGFL